MTEVIDHIEENKGDFSAKEIILISLLSIGVVGGTIYLGRRMVKNSRIDREDRKSMETGSAANYAKRLHVAFDNIGRVGVSEEGIRKVLLEIPDKVVFRAVMKSYKRNDDDNELMYDLEHRLWPTEFEEMNAIIASIPEKAGTPIAANIKYKLWATRLKNAFDINYWGIPGTDTDAVKTVFMEFKSQADFQNTIAAFKENYHLDLMAELRGELEFWEYPDFMDIINSKPKY